MITDEQLIAEIAKAEQRIDVFSQQLQQVNGALLAARGARQALLDLQRGSVADANDTAIPEQA